MSANNAKVQAVIEATFNSAINKLAANEAGNCYSDLYVQVDAESGELLIYDEAGAGSVGIHGAAAFFALYSTTFVVFFKHRNISLPYLAFIIAQKECQRPTRKGNFG